MIDSLKFAKNLYIELLRTCPTDQWRMRNQNIYCNVRDFIAQETGQSPQEVQEEFEENAQIERMEWLKNEKYQAEDTRRKFLGNSI